MRFRKNLAPHTIIEVPKSTSAMDLTALNLTFDEEMYKDV